MKSFVHLVGSPLSVIVFEAAARRGNFTRAAEELNVSQPAVSRHIRNLEARLEVRLFRRRGNKIELTAMGRKLYAAVRDSLDNIYDVVSEIAEEHRSGPIKIRSHATIFTNFIIPSGTQHAAESIGVELEYLNEPNHEPLVAEEPMIAIMYGAGNWNGFHAERLFDDALFPICSPQLLASSLARDKTDVLKRCPLLHLTNYIDDWMDWSRWTSKIDIGSIEGRHQQVFNDYEMLLQSCRAGDGLAIGSLCLVAPSISDGTLVRIGTETVWTRYGYYLVYDPILQEDKRISRLIDYFKNEAVKKSKQFSLNAGLTRSPGSPRR